MTDSFDELSDLAAKLNQKSDQLNCIISMNNARLGELNLGIEHWLESEPVVAEPYHDDFGSTGLRTHRERNATQLGYAKVEDEWQLAFRRALLETQTDEYGDNGEEPVNPTSPQPLLKATRQVRIQSMRLIPKLVDELIRKGQVLLEDIEGAAEAAKRLC